MTRPDPRTLLIGAAVCVTYVLAATFGFSYALVAEQVTTVWAPTGLAQAALLLWGRRLWPAVWLGAFAVNASTTAPLWTACSIATSNTLEAVVAAWLLSRISGFDPALRRTRDTVAFITLAAGLGPVISATTGVVTLCAAGVQAWSSFPSLWFAWYLGDATGALIVGPVILTIAGGAGGRSVRSWLETGVILGGALVVTLAVFGQWIGPTTGHHPLEYIIFPFLITAAVRQGQPATALVVFVSASTAIANTALGSGPFADREPHESLVLLQVFMAIVAGTGLVLAAAIAERRTGENRRAAAHEVSAALATAASLEEASTRLLPGVCRSLGWAYGAVWIIERESETLRCLAAWPPDNLFARTSAGHVFSRGVGLPGRVWASSAPAWIENVQRDANFPRASVARETGLHSAFAFPITAGGEVLGVIEFFHYSILRPDADLLGTMATVGGQLGQFVVREQVEAAVVAGQREREDLLQRELAARRDAEAANRAKDEFLATLSHELRTPLNAILGWTRMLLDGTLEEGKRRRALEVIERNATLQAQLVADILDVSGIITGGMKLNAETVDPVTVIGAALGPAARRRCQGPPAHHGSASRAGPDRRRPATPAAGRVEPRRQCDQIHPARGTGRRRTPRARWSGHPPRPRHRRRHLGRFPPTRVRTVPAGRRLRQPAARRAGAGPRHRAVPGRAPRRQRDGGERRHRSGGHLRRLAAAVEGCGSSR